jgi:hypothetical protein
MASSGTRSPPTHRAVLLARPATRRRGRLRPRHRRAQHGQIGHAAHPHRTARQPARGQGGHRQSAASPPGRLLPRTRRSVRRRTLPAQPLGGAKVLRERWQTPIDASLSRPVLVIDEAQETPPSVLAELRLLASARLTAISCSPSCWLAMHACWNACVPMSCCRSAAACASGSPSNGRHLRSCRRFSCMPRRRPAPSS